MIVTCESCKSRYKLDDAKITGKGAKITCPKCRNVFVVYARPDAGAVDGPPASPPEAGPPAWEPRKSGGLADAVKAADRGADAPGRVVAGTSGASVGAPTGASAGGSPTARPAAPKGPASRGFDEAPTAWDDEPTRVGGVQPPPDEPSHEVRRPSAGGSAAATAASAATSAAAAPVAPSAPAAPRDPAETAARAASLDFRKVGVTTWKVKVKIGLIYDFSDIKTLRKYIQDGRVTAADVVSYDGKAWRAIGDVPDLDAYFCETWDALASRKAESPTLNPTPAPVEAPRSDEPSPVTPQKSGGEPTRFQDPFAAQNRKKAAEGKRSGPITTPPAAKKPEPPPPPAPSRLPMVVGGLVLLVALVAGGVWWTEQSTVTPAAPATKTAAPAAPVKTPEQIRKEIEEGIKQNMTPPEDTPAPSPAEDEPVRVATPVPERAGSGANGQVVIPDGAVPRGPRGTPPTASNMKQADQTAADHEAVGDDAANSGDWGTAAQAYKKAVALDGKSTRLAGKLGRALYETGDYAGAQPLLDRAAAAGTKDARKYLGHIARQNGDTAGANSHYQAYLKGSPRDAADIEKIIAQMSGG